MARFMCGWALLGLGVPATFVWLLFLLGEPLTREGLIVLVAAILDTGLGAWMVSSGAGRWRSDWSASQRARMTRFVWGSVLVVLGVPGTFYWLVLLADLVALRPALAPQHLTLFLERALFFTIPAGLGAWMLWSGARRRASAEYRMPRRKWALALAAGLLTSVAVAARWLFALAVWFYLAFGVMASSPECRRLEFLVFGSLFGAPLVGGIVVLVEWLRGRQRSAPADESQPGMC